MCVGREGELHALARLASPGGAGQGEIRGRTRRTHEWSAEIRLIALQGRGFLLLFYILVAWLLGLRYMEGPVGFLI